MGSECGSTAKVGNDEARDSRETNEEAEGISYHILRSRDMDQSACELSQVGEATLLMGGPGLRNSKQSMGERLVVGKNRSLPSSMNQKCQKDEYAARSSQSKAEYFFSALDSFFE